MIYDQSPQGNHLSAAPARHGFTDLEVNATKDPLSLGGHRVYSAYFEKVPRGSPKEVGVGYRRNNATGTAKGDEPETIYMVTSGTHYDGGCCFVHPVSSYFAGAFVEDLSRTLRITATRKTTSETTGRRRWKP